jgi:Schlafen group 3, DNA/RNA helicase domain
LAPRARFELATLRLTAECSTVELPGIRADNLFIVLCLPRSPQPAAVARLFHCAQFCAHLTAPWRRAPHPATDGYNAGSLSAKHVRRSATASRRRNHSLQKRQCVVEQGASRLQNLSKRKSLGFHTGRRRSFAVQYTSSAANRATTIICDEAHRIRKNSNSRYTKREERSNVPQIDELLKVAKLNIFFIDENQIVRPEEIGSIAMIKDAARQFGLEDGDVSEFELKTQFRCSGSIRTFSGLIGS